MRSIHGQPPDCPPGPFPFRVQGTDYKKERKRVLYYRALFRSFPQRSSCPCLQRYRLYLPGNPGGYQPLFVRKRFFLQSICHRKQSGQRTADSDALLKEPVKGIIAEGCKSALPNPNLDLYRRLMRRGTAVVFFIIIILIFQIVSTSRMIIFTAVPC